MMYFPLEQPYWLNYVCFSLPGSGCLLPISNNNYLATEKELNYERSFKIHIVEAVHQMYQIMYCHVSRKAAYREGETYMAENLHNSIH